MGDRIVFTVEGQRLRTDTQNIHAFAEGTKESVVLQFILPSAWNDYTVFAHFKQYDRFFDEILRTIDSTDNCCYLPIGIADGKCSLSLYGKDSGGHVLTTNCLILHIEPTGLISESFELPQSACENIISMFIRTSGNTNIDITKTTSGWDVSKIYVYLGDDPNFKKWHWYYYDDSNSNWITGGAYTSEVVHIGEGLSLDSETGTASANLGTGLKIEDDRIEIDPETVAMKSDLVNATTETRGLVKVGSGLSVDEYGTISVNTLIGSGIVVGEGESSGIVPTDAARDVWETLTGTNLFQKYCNRETLNSEGVKYEWKSDDVLNIFANPPTSKSSYIVYDTDNIPSWLIPGKSYKLYCDIKNNLAEGNTEDYISVVFSWFNVSGGGTYSSAYTNDSVITIPDYYDKLQIIISISANAALASAHIDADVTLSLYPILRFNGGAYEGDKKLATEEVAQQKANSARDDAEQYAREQDVVTLNSANQHADNNDATMLNAAKQYAVDQDTTTLYDAKQYAERRDTAALVSLFGRAIGLEFETGVISSSTGAMEDANHRLRSTDYIEYNSNYMLMNNSLSSDMVMYGTILLYDNEKHFIPGQNPKWTDLNVRRFKLSDYASLNPVLFKIILRVSDNRTIDSEVLDKVANNIRLVDTSYGCIPDIGIITSMIEKCITKNPLTYTDDLNLITGTHVINYCDYTCEHMPGGETKGFVLQIVLDESQDKKAQYFFGDGNGTIHYRSFADTETGWGEWQRINTTAEELLTAVNGAKTYAETQAATAFSNSEDYINSKAEEVSSDMMGLITGDDLILEYCNRNDVPSTGNRIEFAWNGNTVDIHRDIDGVTGSAWDIIRENGTGLPWWIVPGRSYQLRCSVDKHDTIASGNVAGIQFEFFLGDGSSQATKYYNDAVINVPTDAVDVKISIFVLASAPDHIHAEITVSLYPILRFNGGAYEGDKKLATEYAAKQYAEARDTAALVSIFGQYVGLEFETGVIDASTGIEEPADHRLRSTDYIEYNSNYMLMNNSLSSDMVIYGTILLYDNDKHFIPGQNPKWQDLNVRRFKLSDYASFDPAKFKIILRVGDNRNINSEVLDKVANNIRLVDTSYGYIVDRDAALLDTAEQYAREQDAVTLNTAEQYTRDQDIVTLNASIEAATEMFVKNNLAAYRGEHLSDITDTQSIWYCSSGPGYSDDLPDGEEYGYVFTYRPSSTGSTYMQYFISRYYGRAYCRQKKNNTIGYENWYRINTTGYEFRTLNAFAAVYGDLISFDYDDGETEKTGLLTFELGNVNYNTGEKIDSNQRIRSKEYIPYSPHHVLLNNTIGDSIGISGYVCLYDENNNYIPQYPTQSWTDLYVNHLRLDKYAVYHPAKYRIVLRYLTANKDIDSAFLLQAENNFHLVNTETLKSVLSNVYGDAYEDISAIYDGDETTGYYWNSETANATQTIYPGFVASKPIPVNAGDVYLVDIFCAKSTKQTPVLIVGEPESGAYPILQRYKDANNTHNHFEFTIPDDAAYLLLTTYRSYYSDTIVRKKIFNNGISAKIWDGKTIAILGDSISTNGNSGNNANVPEIKITNDDVGVTLSAYVTNKDVDAGLSIGGTTYTSSDIGNEVTFTPTAGDVGKIIGRPLDYNGNSRTVWWEHVKNALGGTYLPVCWSGSSITSHEAGDDEYKASYAWHESQIRKCGIRTPGSMDRTAPDVIIIYRGTNDVTHMSYAVLTDGFFDSPRWEYPDWIKPDMSDPSTWIRPDRLPNNEYREYGFLEGLCYTVKTLRERYPKARIFLCTLNVFKRINYATYPTRTSYEAPEWSETSAYYVGISFVSRTINDGGATITNYYRCKANVGKKNAPASNTPPEDDSTHWNQVTEDDLYLYTLPQFNNAIRKAADYLGCGLIEFDKDGVTYENMEECGYITESGLTHPYNKGHLAMGRKAIADIKAQWGNM